MSDAAQERQADASDPDMDRPSDFASGIREQAQSYAEKRKADVARAVSDVAHTFRDNGADFANHPHVKAFFDAAAAGVEELSEDINRRTFSELYDEVEAAARRRPAVTFAAAALAGFALFRFLRASEMRPIPRSHAVVPVDVFPTPDV